MSREIEFRAWNKTTGFMQQIRTMFFTDGVICGITPEHRGIVLGIDDVVIMQYTGLKDKHGKKIFEGDVLEQHDVLYLVEGVKAGYFFHEYIKLKNGGTVQGRCFTDGIIAETICEVIGNIYSNPDLLEQAK